MQITYNEIYRYLTEYGNDNYYAFPSTLYTFCTGVCGAFPRIEFLGTGVIIGRHTKREFKICYFDCTVQELHDFRIAEEKLNNKVRVIGFHLPEEVYLENKGILNKAGVEFYAKKGWGLDTVVVNKKADSRSVTKRAYRHGQEMYTIDLNPPKEEAVKVLEDWFVLASLRYWMVLKGHYRSYLQKHFDGILKNTKIIGFRNLEGRLHGIVLYEVFKGKACFCVKKHYVSDTKFAAYCNIKSTEMMLEEVEWVHWSSGGDVGKTYLELNKRQVYTLKK